MPSRYVIRSYSENSYYHIFNRGIIPKIFLDNQDYQIFKYYLFIYLQPLKKVLTKYPTLPLRLQSKNLNEQLDLITYCLMPNHFHFLLKQISADGVTKFMKQLIDAYTRYFNTKYQRMGGLMQGRFKAVVIESDELLLHVSRYIHLNPLVAGLVKDLNNYRWSSYLDFVNETQDSLCKKEVILNHFRSESPYQKFVQDQIGYAKELAKIKHLTIDSTEVAPL